MINSNNWYLWVLIKNVINNNWINYLIKLIKEDYLILIWYIKLILNNLLLLILLKYNIKLYIFLYKNIFFNYYFF